MHVTLVLTHECNLSCTYCYMGDHFRKEMDWSMAERSLDLAFEGFGPVDVGFFGGEPLIKFDMLVRVSEAAIARAEKEERDLRLAVTTNGTLLTQERAKKLAELGVEVTLSLDGVREAHDATRPQRGGQSSYDAVMRGAKAIKDAGMPLDVIAVVAPGNVRYLGETVKLLVEMQCRQIILNPCFELSWTDEDLAAWEKGLEDCALIYADWMRAGKPIAFPTFDNKILAAVKGGLASCDTCSAGTREVAVSPLGNLYPCARMVGEDKDHTLVIGHIDKGIDKLRVESIPRGPLDPACSECAELWRCGASCACANFAETGTTHLPGGTQCWYEQTTARIADAMGAKLLEEQCQTFIQWSYGRVAEATARMHEYEAEKTKKVQRKRRLPVLSSTA